MIVRDENYNDDGYLNPLCLISRLVDLVPPRDRHEKPAKPRSASLLSRCWMRLGGCVFPFAEMYSTVLDERPRTEEEIDELWIDSIGG